jgi:hypothetical protein
MSDAAVYSASAITVLAGGIEIDQDNIGTEDFVTEEPQVKAFTVRVGLGGGITYSENKGLWSKVTVKVRQCASVNDKLAALFNLDTRTPGGSGIIPFYLKDRNGNYKFACLQARLESDPGWTAGAEEKDLDWVFLCPTPEKFAGGH